ncbi:tail fiber assembly protein [Klebsiella phage ViciousJeremy]
MEKIYENFKQREVTDEYRKAVGAPSDARFFMDDEGNDWYDLMYKLDSTGKYTVAFYPDGYVSYAATTVAGRHGCDGCSVTQVDTLPGEFKTGVYWFFNRETHSVEERERPTYEEPKRTKEDIMADLLKLQKELQAM